MERDAQKTYLIRHGETEWSRAGRHTGVTDVVLTAHGRETARLLQPVLAQEKFTLVLSSPLQRARETCELAGLRESSAVEPDLREWNYGEYEGLTTKQIADRLFISPKTADHHIQHVYTKIGVSTRGAAALYAIENGILLADSA